MMEHNQDTLNQSRYGARRLLIAGLALAGIAAILMPLAPALDFIPPAVRVPLIVATMLLLPGYLLDEWLHIGGEEVTFGSPALWLALSTGLHIPASMIVLLAHLNMRWFGIIAAVVLVILASLTLYFRRSPRPVRVDFSGPDRYLWAIVAILFIISVVMIAGFPPISSDEYAYGADLRDFVEQPQLNRWDQNPALGDGYPPSGRMAFNGWLVTEAYMGFASGLDPIYGFMGLLKPVLVIFVFSAFYALACSLFGSHSWALAAVAIQVLTLWLSPITRRLGDFFMIRLAEDKSIAMLILIPVAIHLLLRMISDRPDTKRRIGLALIAFTLSAIDPVFYILLVISCGLLFVSMVIFRRPREDMRRLVMVTVTSVLPAATITLLAGLAMSRAFHIEESFGPAAAYFEAITAVSSSSSTPFSLRAALRPIFSRPLGPRSFVLGSTGIRIAAPAYLLYPTVLAGVVSAILMICRRHTRNRTSVFLIGQQLGPLLVFIPGVANITYALISYDMTWRLGLIIWPGLTITGLLWHEWQNGTLEKVVSWWRTQIGERIPCLAKMFLMAGLVSILALAVAVPVRIYSDTEEAGAISGWTKNHGLYDTLRSAEPAITLMNSPRILSSRVVMNEIPSILSDVSVVQFRSEKTLFWQMEQEEALRRMELTYTLTYNPWSQFRHLLLDESTILTVEPPQASATDAGFLDLLSHLDVDLIVLDKSDYSHDIARKSLAEFPLAFLPVVENDDWVIFLVNLDEDEHSAAIGQAQLALARGDTVDGCARFDRLLAERPDDPMTGAGAGYCREVEGDAEEANRLYLLARQQMEEWTVELPAKARSWLVYNPDLGRQFSEEVRQDAARFVLERRYLASNEVESSLPFESIWIGGWPRLALTQPANTSHWLHTSKAIGDRLIFHNRYNSEPIIVKAGNKPALSERVVTSITVDQDSTPMASWWIEPDDELQLTHTAAFRFPDQTTGTIRLDFLSEDQSAQAVWWFDWSPVGIPEETVTPTIASEQDIRRLASWLLKNAPAQTASTLNSRSAARIARAALQGDPALAALNLVRNSGFDVAAAEWNLVRQNGASSFSVEHGKQPDDWAGTLRSAGEGYQGGWCQTLSVEPNTKYFYLLDAKMELEEAGKAQIGYWDYTRLGAVMHSETALTTWRSSDWQPVWMTIKTPLFAKEISICPALISGAGVIQIDNVRLIAFDDLLEE